MQKYRGEARDGEYAMTYLHVIIEGWTGGDGLMKLSVKKELEEAFSQSLFLIEWGCSMVVSDKVG